MGKGLLKMSGMDESSDFRKVPAFRWNAQKQQAAQLLAEDELTDVEIAQTVGISDRQMRNWKHVPEFMDRVKEIIGELGDVVFRRAIGRRSRRLLCQENRWLAMQRVIRERAADPCMQNVPGGQTGLLVRTVKSIGAGTNFKEVEEYEFDAALVKAIADVEKQAAQECGQWTERHEHSGDQNNPIQHGHTLRISLEEFKKLSTEEKIRVMRERTGG